jgi:DNA polymerase
MSLDLDRRQRAMLQEMGLRVWWPETTLAAPAATVEGADIKVRNAPAAVQNPASTAAQENDLIGLPKLAVDIDSMDWPTLSQTVAQCQACQLCLGRRCAVFGAGAAPQQADWLLLGEPPDDNEERLGEPFAGQAGQLLDNMLKAVGASRRGGDGRAAYVTNVVKCRPAAPRNPRSQDLATCENYLRREVALVQPRVILALGRFAAQALLQGSLPDAASIPLGKLRGQVYRYQGIAVIVSYHPGYLLRTPQDKARAWADWCLALELVGPPAR